MLSFSKTYELPLARDYVRHWGLVEAVREILQNAIDSESPFEWEWIQRPVEITQGNSFEREFEPSDETILIVRSRYAKLSAGTLLLGSTSKAENQDAIGSFGEGYKIALLVLTRLGYRVVVHNGDRDWVPSFRPSRQFGGAETLHIHERSATAPVEGVEFEIPGLSAADVAAIEDSCLHMQSSLGEVINTSYGRILPERPGKLYVGGLFVCDTEMKYGYDVKPQHLRLERDRQTVSSFDLAMLTKAMWFDSGRHAQVADMIAAQAPDMEYAHWDTPEVVKEAVFQVFRKQHPGAIVAKSAEDLKQKIEAGLSRERIVYIGDTYGAIVRESKSYREMPATRIAPPIEELENFFRANRQYMRTPAIVAFKRLIERSKAWKA